MNRTILCLLLLIAQPLAAQVSVTMGYNSVTKTNVLHISLDLSPTNPSSYLGTPLDVAKKLDCILEHGDCSPAVPKEYIVDSAKMVYKSYDDLVGADVYFHTPVKDESPWYRCPACQVKVTYWTWSQIKLISSFTVADEIDLLYKKGDVFDWHQSVYGLNTIIYRKWR
ncbi:MAG: hypothetical protein V1712_01700 [Patescibacteria group bacterium]